MLIGILLSILWIICGLLAYGFTFSFFQKEFPPIAIKDKKKDKSFALMIGLLGPIGLVVMIISKGYKHGWSIK